MLSFFRRNLFINLISLLIFAVVFHVYYFFIPPNIEVLWNAPFLENLLGFIFDNIWSKIVVSILLIVVQAYLINSFVTKHKLSRALSTIPAAVFILYSAWVLESDVFQPVLLANLFCTLSLGRLFDIYKKHLPIATIFNSGLYMAIAAIIYPPYFLFLIVLLLGLFSLRNLTIRESLQLIIGMLAPYFFIVVLLFFFGQDKEQYYSLFLVLQIPELSQPFDILSLLKPIIACLLILFSISIHHQIKKKKKFDAIKKVELCYWLIFISLSTVFFMNPTADSHLLMIATPLAIIIGLLLEIKSNRLVKEFVFLLAIAGFFGFQIAF